MFEFSSVYCRELAQRIVIENKLVIKIFFITRYDLSRRQLSSRDVFVLRAASQENRYSGVPTRSDTNRGVQRQEMAKGLNVVSISCFGVRVSVMYHFMFVHYTFSSVWVVEWPPFGK